VFHYREDRIRAHIQLFWLALLLLRVIENITSDTWRNTRRELDLMHLIALATSTGQVAQRSVTTPGSIGRAAGPRPARTPQIPRLHPPRQPLNHAERASSRSNTTPTEALGVSPGQPLHPTARVLLIFGSHA